MKFALRVRRPTNRWLHSTRDIYGVTVAEVGVAGVGVRVGVNVRVGVAVRVSVAVLVTVAVREGVGVGEGV